MIPWVKPKLWGGEREALLDAFDSSWFSAGAYVDKLEKRFSAIHQSKHAITTCNGTASLYLILEVLGIGPGDQVIVPGFAFGAAANIVSALGASPLFCDVEEDSFLLNCLKCREILENNPRVKAIIPVHSYGSVCDMDALLDLAKDFNVHIVEDNAEAMFSKYKGRYAGTFGVANSFSFQTTKTITTAEGGCILTDSDELADRMRLIRSHGMQGEKKYWHYERGNNFRLSNLLASIGYAQLNFYEENIEERSVLYRKYRDLFVSLPGIRLQRIGEDVDPAMWAFPVYVDEDYSRLSRDEMMVALREAQIETRPGFYTFAQMKMHGAHGIPVSDRLASRIICLPFYPGLSDESIEKILREFLKLKR